jgi:hypothetical protein
MSPNTFVVEVLVEVEVEVLVVEVLVEVEVLVVEVEVLVEVVRVVVVRRVVKGNLLVRSPEVLELSVT